jgi:2-amino-4-hydroxy-6-hydroxymethyldihydropteridine diphosphokinase
MPDVYLGLGSNMGNRSVHLANARNAIAEKVGQPLAASSIYDTAPWGPVPQDNYLNQVVLVSAQAEPHALLETLHEIEQAAGRDRNNEVRYGPRVLDLDILLYGDRAVNEGGLVIPHPRIAERAFVLVPLAEITPDIKIGGAPLRELLGRIDTTTVHRYDPI